MVIAAFLGLRRGELCGLQWQDFDTEAGHLTVQRQVLRYAKKLNIDELKTSRSRRLLTLAPFLVSELPKANALVLLDPDTDFVAAGDEVDIWLLDD